MRTIRRINVADLNLPWHLSGGREPISGEGRRWEMRMAMDRGRGVNTVTFLKEGL